MKRVQLLSRSDWHPAPGRTEGYVDSSESGLRHRCEAFPRSPTRPSQISLVLPVRPPRVGTLDDGAAQASRAKG
ncbi:hypothetical protein GUJ93_ZPchr0012g20291 [Zizania palustris]|uniref:Uncharacterized protein n=1 Tax=Zizania palustris TaxID=103762 RepID=A0A8J5WQV3_ZIZPA|nr:hypothetical protein GUJ93_ZPchr0012g20291 [Zizania palustris]